MAINKKLIHFQKLADFQTQLSAGNILDTSIVFIKDAKQIYTHGQIYPCSYTLEELTALLSNKANLSKLDDYLTKASAENIYQKKGNYITSIPTANGSTAGIVKQGGDVTIANGVISVVDDSHNHIISNVDGLQDALNNKVPTSRTINGKVLSNNITLSAADVSADASGSASIAEANAKSYTDTKISQLVNGAPETLNTLNELATAITEHEDVTDLLDAAITNKADKSELPTKVSQLENDVPYALRSDVVFGTEINNGVYIMTASGDLVDKSTVSSTALGVVLITDNQRILISKADATDGTNTTLYWGKNLYGMDVAGITNISSSDAAKQDFNGKANTDAIIAAYGQHNVDMDSRGMCKVLASYAEGGFTDWYVPAAGQLYEMYNKMSDINTALAKIGGTAFESDGYWSSSEYDSVYAWGTNFDTGDVDYGGKGYDLRVRFVRNITTTKHLKEVVSELNAILVDTNETADDPIIQEYASVQYVDQAISNLEINKLDKTEADNIYAGKFVETSKQDVLVSGTNIKTINGQSILGGGNVKLVSSLTDLDGIITNGDGTKYLSNDGTYKTISTSNSQAGISQIVTTSNVNYPLLYTPSNQTVTTNTANTYFNSGIYANAYTQSLYATNFYTTSDKQFKTNIQKIKDSENCPIIKQFDWKENETRSYGFIAQELEELGYVELVDTDQNGLKKVNYNAALSLVIGKLQNKIEQLEQKIMELENKLSKN